MQNIFKYLSLIIGREPQKSTIEIVSLFTTSTLLFYSINKILFEKEIFIEEILKITKNNLYITCFVFIFLIYIACHIINCIEEKIIFDGSIFQIVIKIIIKTFNAPIAYLLSCTLFAEMYAWSLLLLCNYVPYFLVYIFSSNRMFFTKKINNSNGRNYVIFRMDKKTNSISEIEFINNIFNKQKNDVIFSLKEVFSNEKNIFVTIEVLSYENYDNYYHYLIQEYKNNNIHVEILKIDNSNLLFENLNSLKTIFKK